MLLYLAGDDTEILRNNQEQVFIPVGNILETTHSMRIQHVTRSRSLVTFLKRVEWNDKYAIDFMFPNISSSLSALLDSGIWSTGQTMWIFISCSCLLVRIRVWHRHNGNADPDSAADMSVNGCLSVLAERVIYSLSGMLMTNKNRNCKLLSLTLSDDSCWGVCCIIYVFISYLPFLRHFCIIMIETNMQMNCTRW